MKVWEIKATEVNERGQNKNLRFHIVDKDIMRKVGFEHTDGFWILCECSNDVSVNIKISDDEVGEIDVLDDEWLQPYDFQYMIQSRGDYAPQTAKEIQKKLYSILDAMKTFGILEGWEWGDYV